MHEALQHKLTSFITLTYRDDALPSPSGRPSRPDGRGGGLPEQEGSGTAKSRTRVTRTHEETEAASLSKRDLQAFTKRLNEETRRKRGAGVKYYACGEYGERTGRPHYHIAVYGEDFSDDRQFWKHARSGHPLWRSSRLKRLWPHGDADIGDLTFESAAYVARYIMKKITGTMAHDHYKRVDREGREYWLEPEFSVMSRRPGLAREWFMNNSADVYPADNVISRGNPAKPPRYYDKLLETLSPEAYAIMKFAREIAERNPEDNTPARLEAREIVTLAKLKQNQRSLE